jgi:hypothetical protein
MRGEFPSVYVAGTSSIVVNSAEEDSGITEVEDTCAPEYWTLVGGGESLAAAFVGVDLPGFGFWDASSAVDDDLIVRDTRC